MVFTVVQCLGQKSHDQPGRAGDWPGWPKVAELSWNSEGSPVGSVQLVCAVCQDPADGVRGWVWVIRLALFGGLSLGLGSGDRGLDLGWEGREASDGWTHGHRHTLDWALCWHLCSSVTCADGGGGLRDFAWKEGS